MNFFKKIGKKIEKTISNIIPHTHSAERRATMAAAKEQINFYHEQKEELTKARQATETEKTAERSRINEKQIKARQRTYRRGGFMAPPVSEVKNQLG